MDKTLPEAEWNFAWCDETDLLVCFNWEYLRELIRSNPGAALKIRHPFLPMELRKPNTDDIVYAKTPRGELYKLLNKYFPDFGYADLPISFRQQLRTLSSSNDYRIPGCSLRVTQSDPMPHTWVDDLLSGDSVMTVAIDWRLSNDALAKHFREIVEGKRSKQAVKRSGEDRYRKLRTALKQLGARRILKFVKRDFKEVRDIAASLYGLDSAWIKADNQASEALDRFYEHSRLKF